MYFCVSIPGIIMIAFVITMYLYLVIFAMRKEICMHKAV